MRCSFLIRATLAVIVTAMSVGYANAQEFLAVFSGFNEIGGLGAGETGAILSTGQGRLRLSLNTQTQQLSYTLSYSNLGAPVAQAHIHFGKARVAGGIMVFLCTNLGNGPAGTPACPAAGGTVTGTLTPASVIGPIPQNIVPGNFAGVVAALTSLTAYGNIHTTQFPAGEIRGEIVQCPPTGCP
jgi:CHRD domain-containing protein